MTRHPTEIISRPLITEKGSSVGEKHNHVLFEVAVDANKIDISRAVEKLYNVRVVWVHTQVMRGKKKRVGRHAGMCRNWKKAIVKLDQDSTIDFFSVMK